VNKSVPQHLYGLVDRAILTGLGTEPGKEFEPCVIIGVTSIPSRAIHFSILCESGAQWARIPLHMVRHEEPEKEPHEITALQMWDCMGYEFETIQYEYLREMDCEYIDRKGARIPASYWFTLDHKDNGFSLYPPQHKCFHLLLLNDGSGQIAAQPNNRIYWKDFSFCKPGITEYKVMSAETYHAETDINPQQTAITKE
jgi:hypothetical protein